MTTISSWSDAGASVSWTAESLPAGLRYARNEALGSEFTESQARKLKPADEGAAASGHLATIDDPGRAGIPRKLGQTSVILLCLELSPDGGVLLDRRAFTLISVNPGHFRHKGTRKLARFGPFATRFYPFLRLLLNRGPEVVLQT